MLEWVKDIKRQTFNRNERSLDGGEWTLSKMVRSVYVGRIRVTIKMEKRKGDRNENERNMKRERSIRANAGRREKIEKAYSLLSW